MNKPKCIRCKKTPEQIREYSHLTNLNGLTPSQWVRENEPVGCWGKGPDAFYCTDCYIKAGMPLRKPY